MSARALAVVLLALSVACFTAGAGLAAWYYSSKVEALDLQLKKCTGTNKDFKESVANQNEKILALNDLSALQAAQYKALIDQPEKLRFKIKYVEVKSNECADIKGIIDDIRIHGF